jgi:hypothetical protein
MKVLDKKERTQLELLCADKIPRLLNGGCPEVVFGYVQRLPKCIEPQKDYSLGDDFGEFLYPKR